MIRQVIKAAENRSSKTAQEEEVKKINEDLFAIPLPFGSLLEVFFTDLAKLFILFVIKAVAFQDSVLI